MTIQERYGAGQDGQCPHCGRGVHFLPAKQYISPSGNFAGTQAFTVVETAAYSASQCPSCNLIIVWISITKNIGGAGSEEFLVWPFLGQRKAPPDVPSHIAKDYVSASRLVNVEPNASAALSRRCLQELLREVAGTTKRDLADQIQEVLDSGTLPSQLADNLDAVRNIGNFAAHLSKSQATGSIVETESEEAEWNLEVLEGLFDFYYVQPEKNRRRRDGLNAKLDTIGKPPMKSP